MTIDAGPHVKDLSSGADASKVAERCAKCRGSSGCSPRSQGRGPRSTAGAHCVIARAPGKVVLSGAYAVLEGAPALVAAVDRYVVADWIASPIG